MRTIAPLDPRRAGVWIYRLVDEVAERIEAEPEVELEGPVPDDVRERLRALGYEVE